jgi:hypothetical protein
LVGRPDWPGGQIAFTYSIIVQKIKTKKIEKSGRFLKWRHEELKRQVKSFAVRYKKYDFLMQKAGQNRSLEDISPLNQVLKLRI